jgi:hypothetical protein
MPPRNQNCPSCGAAEGHGVSGSRGSFAGRPCPQRRVPNLSFALLSTPLQPAPRLFAPPTRPVRAVCWAWHHARLLRHVSFDPMLAPVWRRALHYAPSWFDHTRSFSPMRHHAPVWAWRSFRPHARACPRFERHALISTPCSSMPRFAHHALIPTLGAAGRSAEHLRPTAGVRAHAPGPHGRWLPDRAKRPFG